jgi:hypothetical protein
MFYFLRAVQKDVEQKMAEHVLGKFLIEHGDVSTRGNLTNRF